MVAGAFPLNRNEAPPTAQISGGWGSAVQAPKGCGPPETPLVGTEQPCDPAIPLADVYPKEVKTTQKEACVPVFIAASFTTNQDAEITWVSVSGQVERDMSDSRRGILFNHKKNEVLPFAENGWTLRALW